MSGMITSWLTMAFGGDDARLGEADIATGGDALLGMADGCALHRAFHRARTAAGADIDAAQAQLVAHLLGVLVLDFIDRVAAPAHGQVGLDLAFQNACVAQHMEHGIGDVGAVVEVEAATLVYFVRDEDHVAQHGEQVLLDATDHLAIDKGAGRGVADLQADPPGMAHYLDVEIPVAVEQQLGVVAVTA
jgi:hypothetical protein